MSHNTDHTLYFPTMSEADFDNMMASSGYATGAFPPSPTATASGKKPTLPADYIAGGHWQLIQGFDPATKTTIPFTDPDHPPSALQTAKANAAFNIRKDSRELDYYYDKDIGQWVIYQIQDPTLYTDRADADAEIARRMKEANETGTPLWKAYHPEKEAGWRIMDNPDVANLLDPDNPIRQQIDLGNGQTLYVLSNGKSFTGPTKPDMDWEGWDPDKNIQTMGDREYAIMPDGKIAEVTPEKTFQAGDIHIVNRYKMQDGSEVVIFNDGTKLNVEKGEVPSTVTAHEESGYWQVTDNQGNITLKEPLTPTGIEYTAAGFNIAGTDIQDLGLPERPATLETIGGQQFVRGTEAGLTALDGVLDRMIEHALVTGNKDAALAWDDFRKRPSSLEVLEKAMEWAETPGDQQLISALHHASSAQVAGMPGGLGPTPEDIAAGDQFAEVAAPPAFAQDAYQRFQESITGGRLPTENEFAAAIAREEEPPPPTVREQLELDLLNAELAEAEANTLRLDAQSEAKLAKSSAEAEAILLAANTKADLLIKEAEDRITRLNRELDFKMEQTLPIAEGTETPVGPETPGATTTLSADDLAIIAASSTSGEAFAQRGPDAITIEKLNTLMANLSPEQKALITELYGTISGVSNASGDSMAALLATLNSAFEGADLPRIGIDGGRPPVDIWFPDGTKRSVPYALAHAPGGYLDSGHYFSSLEAWQEAHPGEVAGGEELNEDNQANIVETNITAGDVEEERTYNELVQAGAITGETTATLGDPETGITGGAYGQFGDSPAAGLSLEDFLAASAKREDLGQVAATVPMDVGEETVAAGDPGFAARFAASLEPSTVFDLGGLAGTGALPLSGTTSGTTSSTTSGTTSGTTMGQLLNPLGSGPSVLPILNMTTGEPAFGGFGIPTAAGITRGLGNVISAVPNPLELAKSVSPVIAQELELLGRGAKSIYEKFPSVERQREAEKLEAEERLSYSNLDWYAGGGVINDNTAIVGESGPELAVFPNGTEIVPLDRKMKPDQARRLRRRGVRGMQEGGLVFPEQGEPGLGLSRALAGQSVGPSQGRIFRKAGFTTPSAQALRNLLPEELEQFRAMGARARIPEATFERELGQGIPSGERRTGSARFLPLSLRT